VTFFGLSRRRKKRRRTNKKIFRPSRHRARGGPSSTRTSPARGTAAVDFGKRRIRLRIPETPSSLCGGWVVGQPHTHTHILHAVIVVIVFHFTLVQGAPRRQQQNRVADETPAPSVKRVVVGKYNRAFVRFALYARAHSADAIFRESGDRHTRRHPVCAATVSSRGHAYDDHQI